MIIIIIEIFIFNWYVLLVFIFIEKIFGIIKVIIIVNINKVELCFVLYILKFCFLYLRFLIKKDNFFINNKFLSIDFVKEVNIILINFVWSVKIEMISLIVLLKVVFNNLFILGLEIIVRFFVVLFIKLVNVIIVI